MDSKTVAPPATRIEDLPSPEDFFLRTPLYRDLQWEEDLNRQQVELIKDFAGPLDAFCPECQQESIFEREGYESRRGVGSVTNPSREVGIGSITMSGPPVAIEFRSGGIIHWKFICSRNRRHIMEFWAKVTVSHGERNPATLPEGGKTAQLITTGSFTKVGQYPSVADLYKQDAKKYRKLLGKQYADFIRALGLFAHGIGTGSFVYLRRIFEDLIEEAHTQAKNKQDWNEGLYQQNRWDQRIETLKDSLPEFLVSHAKIYSILSKGIHELTEEECLEYFPILQVGIEFILDDRLALREREHKKNEAEKAIATLHGTLKS